MCCAAMPPLSRGAGTRRQPRRALTAAPARAAALPAASVAAALASRAPGSASVEPHARLRRGRPQPAGPRLRVSGAICLARSSSSGIRCSVRANGSASSRPVPERERRDDRPVDLGDHVAARRQRLALELGEPVECGVVVHRAEPQDHDRRLPRGLGGLRRSGGGAPRSASAGSSSRRWSSIISCRQFWMHVVSLLATNNLC